MVKSPLDKYFLGRSRVDLWTGEPKMCLPPQPNIGTKQQAPIPFFRCPAVALQAGGQKDSSPAGGAGVGLATWILPALPNFPPKNRRFLCFWLKSKKRTCQPDKKRIHYRGTASIGERGGERFGLQRYESSPVSLCIL